MKRSGKVHEGILELKATPEFARMLLGSTGSLYGIVGKVDAKKHSQNYSGHFKEVVAGVDATVRGRFNDPFVGEKHGCLLHGRHSDTELVFRVSHSNRPVVDYEFHKREVIGQNVYLWIGKYKTGSLEGFTQCFVTEFKR